MIPATNGTSPGRRTNAEPQGVAPQPTPGGAQSKRGGTFFPESEVMHGPHAFLGSNEATYGLRQGGAGFHRNRAAAGKARPTLSARIVRRVQNADVRW